MKDSVVWYYQELARRVGLARMQKCVSSASPTATRTSRAGSTASGWARSLRISPDEQVDFLSRFARRRAARLARALARS